MGHYRADLACDTCGEARCTCPPKEEKPNRSFIVTDEYKVMTVDEFTTAHDLPGRSAHLYLLGAKQFKRRASAEAHARKMLELEVEQARAHLLELKKLLKVIRPWEKK